MKLVEIDTTHNDGRLIFASDAFMASENNEESFTCSVRFTGTEAEEASFWEIMREILVAGKPEDHDALVDHCSDVSNIEVSRVRREEWISDETITA